MAQMAFDKPDRWWKNFPGQSRAKELQLPAEGDLNSVSLGKVGQDTCIFDKSSMNVIAALHWVVAVMFS